ncbi:hypothetical protein COLINT_02937 [Collinsella intestinalis DSM 13280]|uniref:Uncharacterized protein n=1 Tax=Collinsella intestinalis DSM 13280 TaxID=521003 RepID=C4FA45_9ACTN|nr:hypothetical protein COLINT_02937 [Collinsella intestinalis DSM 13280]
MRQLVHLERACIVWGTPCKWSALFVYNGAIARKNRKERTWRY